MSQGAPAGRADRHGLLVTIEGGEGSGKTTQCDRLVDGLSRRGWDALRLREPGGTAAGERVRTLLLDAEHGPRSARAELLLYLAARAELTDEVIRPALDQGRIVLCDRYVDASVAYQGGGRELGIGAVTELNRFATSDLVPDLTFLLDIDPRVGLARIAGRGRPDRLEREALAFHQRVRETYRSLAAGARWVVLDAERLPDELTATILAETLRRLPATSR